MALGQAKEVPVVFPVHPRTKEALARAGISLEGVTIIDPVGYRDMARLLDGAVAVFTDSGGSRRRPISTASPCVTLRSETEWVELVDCGWNRLWTEPGYRPRAEVKDYGAGDAAERILDYISRHDLGEGGSPPGPAA